MRWHDCWCIHDSPRIKWCLCILVTSSEVVLWRSPVTWSWMCSVQWLMAWENMGTASIVWMHMSCWGASRGMLRCTVVAWSMKLEPVPESVKEVRTELWPKCMICTGSVHSWNERNCLGLIEVLFWEIERLSCYETQLGSPSLPGLGYFCHTAPANRINVAVAIQNLVI